MQMLCFVSVYNVSVLNLVVYVGDSHFCADAEVDTECSVFQVKWIFFNFYFLEVKSKPVCPN